ncbi:MAG: hypothetical protein WBB01_21690 [Phormidesmis sp.]
MAAGLWDMAGVDGLAVAISLFGEAAGRLAPFQSLETVFRGQDCSVLRLCDRNFRIACSHPLDSLIASLQADVWIQQYDWLSVVAIAPDQLPKLIEQATVRPPHRLDLPNHQAVPAQIAETAVLLWRHTCRDRPVIDLHVARSDSDRLIEQINVQTVSA